LLSTKQIFTTASSYDSGNGTGSQSFKGKESPAAGNCLRLYKTIGTADSLIVPLRYVVPIQTITSAGVLGNLRFTSNAFDVDAALGSTAMAGFAEYATLYSRFRTMQMSYKFDVVNSDAVGCNVLSGFLTASLASTALGANYVENPYMKMKMIGGINGASRTTLGGRCRCEDLFGTKQALYDDLFTGSTTSSTLSSSATMNLYLGVAWPTIPTNGVIVTGFVTLLVHFFRRNSLIS